HDIVNGGRITSAGKLTVRAGGSIINALPAGATGSAPVMQAVTNLNLQAANIVNGGLIASQLGAVNAYTQQLINSGTIQALGGSVQIANLAGNTLRGKHPLGSIVAQDEIGFQTLGSTSQSKAMLSVMGGTLSADDVSFVSPDGRIRAEVDRIDGSVNVSGGMADIGVAAGNLDLATMNLTGDPI